MCVFRVIIFLTPLFFLLVMVSCSILLQPTTPFDRRRIARGYGKILCQSNPNCENCTDQFVLKQDDGRIITLIINYDGTREVLK